MKTEPKTRMPAAPHAAKPKIVKPTPKAANGKTDKPAEERRKPLTIGEEIQQHHFRSEAEKAYINLVFTGNYLASKMQVLLRQFDGLTHQQYNILRILRGQQGKAISLLDVKCRMLDRQPDVSRIIERMVKKGLINRSVCGEDRRQVDLTITSAGLKLLNEIGDKHQQTHSALFKLNDAELVKLNKLLDFARSE